MKKNPSDVILRSATVADLPVLARIHKLTYSRNHFTARLSSRTLAGYYRHFLDKSSEICVAIKGHEVLGFAVYGTHLSERISTFKKVAVLEIFLTCLGNPFIAASKLFNALLARFSARNQYMPAEFTLLSIAVERQGQGIGRCLLQHVTKTAEQRGEKVVGLYVNAYNTNAINAYFDAGYVIRHHQRGQFYMEKYLEK